MDLRALRARLCAIGPATPHHRGPKRMSDVHCTTSCSLFDLFPATEPVGDDQRVRRCISHGRQEHELAYLRRDVEMIRFEAKTACHAATSRVERLQAGGHLLQ